MMTLRVLVKKCGGQAKVAAAARMHLSAICHMLAGRRALGLHSATRIARATGTRVALRGQRCVFTGRPRLRGNP